MAKCLPAFRGDGEQYGWAVFCPGCQHCHIFNCEIAGEPSRPERHVWTFDRNLESPTFLPSMRTFFPARPDQSLPERTLCHSHVTAGMISFLDDSTSHKLRGVHPLSEILEGYYLQHSPAATS